MHKSIEVEHRNHCSICAGKTISVLNLPDLPFTDSYSLTSASMQAIGVDQQLLYCESCGHGQLGSLISPDTLYGTNYCFRTSDSSTAKKGTEFFLSVLEEVAPNRRFKCILDLGCNDLFLLDRLSDRALHRVGIDPVWTGREDKREDKSIQLFGMNFEDVDLTQLPEKPDLIVCRHTLEHIIDPVKVVRSLIEVASPDAVFIFEVPGFDGLIQRYRFDQIFHQHAQYFSLTSFLSLLNVVGGNYLTHRYNFHDWGAMAIAFTGNGNRCGKNLEIKRWGVKEILRNYEIFQAQMESAGKLLEMCIGPEVYGYGAAQMLPVIAYHMGSDLSRLAAILDDDESKDGIGYWNLPVKIISSKKIQSFKEATILITAIDNVQPIMMKLLANRPKHIILPLNII